MFRVFFEFLFSVIIVIRLRDYIGIGGDFFSDGWTVIYVVVFKSFIVRRVLLFKILFNL